MSAGVLVVERPIERGDVNAAAGFTNQVEPRLVDGGVGSAGVEDQTLRNALHQNNPGVEIQMYFKCFLDHYIQ